MKTDKQTRVASETAVARVNILLVRSVKSATANQMAADSHAVAVRKIRNGGKGKVKVNVRYLISRCYTMVSGDDNMHECDI